MKCLAPWKAIAVRFNGDITPDCVYTGRHGNLNEDILPSIMQHPGLLNTQLSIKNGILPPNCSQCTKKEQLTEHSRRIFFDKILHDTPRTYENDIRFLEVNISNKCNLKCLMCSGVNSTAWVKEDIKLSELGIERPINHPDFGYRIVNESIIDKLFQYPSYFKNLQYVNIKGGEPFMEEDNIKLLKKLLDMNLHKQVTIDISTNGTIENPEFEELLLEFNTKIHISIEAVGKLYNYIRGGNQYSWEQFVDNLPRFDKFDRVILAGTIMTYNVRQFKDVILWNINRTSRNELFFNNVVTTPEYLNPSLLPNDILYGTGFTHDSNLTNQLDVFVKYTRHLDELRNTDILEVCPELSSIFS
jgi:MoaA/NifB/PqqE/SkfB family radical SAM enzyme